MQAHHSDPAPRWMAGWLPLADALDRMVASSTRARLHAQANLARAARGLAPIEHIAGPASPHAVVADGPLMRLLHYPARRNARPIPVVVVASLINRYYVLDLLRETSVLGAMNERGLHAYVLDWKAPGDEGPGRTLGDFALGAIDQAVEAAKRAHRCERVAVVGYCMGGTMATMYAARHPAKVAALCLLGTPIDFHASGELAGWTAPDRFDVDGLVAGLGNMPPALMQSGFKAMNPVDALMKGVHLWLDADDEARVRHAVALESWLEDNVAFAGGAYREYIRSLYQENALARGAMRLGGDPVDLRQITAPLLNVLALRDHICAPPSTRALMDLVGSPDKQLLEFETGHIGLTTSPRAHRELWPRILGWLEERTA